MKALGIENQELKIISLVWIFNEDFLLTLSSLHGNYLGSNYRNSLPKKITLQDGFKEPKQPQDFLQLFEIHPGGCSH